MRVITAALFSAIICGGAVAPVSRACAAETGTSFADDVFPILKGRCTSCHQAGGEGYQKSGLDIPWERVYGYTHAAHVRFNHAPHLRASVECSTCHGNIAQQTVAERNIDLNMGFCVNCHRQKNAPNDCLTCHY